MQVGRVVVVDDGSPEEFDDVLERSRETGAVILKLTINSGIAAALNLGLVYARDHLDPTWFLTMDQDSNLDPNYVISAIMTYDRARKESGPVGLICAESYNNEAARLLRRSDRSPEAFDPMQSGTLIHKEVVETVGLLNDSYFIDCVDSEYTLRVRAAGYRAIVGLGCNLRHALGEKKMATFFGREVTILGRKRSVPYHAPFRFYYITRNGLLLYSRYFRSHPTWIIRRIFLDLKFHAKPIIFGPQRAVQLLAFVLGSIDAILGKTGKISSWQSRLLPSL